ncbi:IgGFc-binding protein-like [Polymixia lowei]
MTSARSSSLLRVKSTLPVSVVASFCTQAGCDHSLLHGVPFWGTHYYPIAPLFPDQTVVSQVVITSSDQETSVDVVLSGEVVFEGNLYPRSSVLKLHIGALGSVQLQSNASLSGSEIHSQQAVCVVVGFTCSKSTPTNCSYGFAELEPVSQWGFDYAIPALVNTGMSSSFLLAMTTINSELEITVGTERKNVSVVSSVMEVIPVMSSDEIHIASDNPLQLLYFRHGTGNSSSSFVAMRSVDDVCHTLPKFDSVDMIEQLHGSTRDGKRWYSDIKFSGPNSAQLPDETKPRSQAELDVGLFLNATSCEDLHCRHKRECGMTDGKPFCSLKTKICSAWGDSYYRTFDGRRFELQGNCNYTLVQTTCPGLNVSVPVQINIARDFSKGATIAAIHTVQVWIQGFNISMVKEEKHQIRIDGQRRNLPLTLGNGSLNVYPSGSSVVLDTTFGLILQYDWHQNLQVEVGPELYGSLCGLCGNANHNTTDDFIAPNGIEQPQAVDFFVHWRLNSAMVCPTNSHYESCGSACPATCGNPEAQYGCSLPCVESCQCNVGYMLSGGKCVPYSQCGCTHQDAYYLPEENVWVGQQCQKRCVCQATSRKVTCAQSRCQAGEVCKVINGVLGCHVDGSGVCIAKGDHHYTTFDGRNFDFHGNCTYLLAGHCPSWGDLDDFRVEVRNQMKENTSVTFSRLIKMFVHGYSIEMSRDWSHMVVVNGLLLSLPSVLSHGKVMIYMIGLSMRIETDFGVIVTYNSDLLTVQVPRVFSGALCGLCGDFNTDPEDDLKTETDIYPFVRRWRTSSGQGCVDAVPRDTSQCRPRDEALYIGDDYCGRLLDTEGAFQNCHKAVDPHIFFENCVHDLCYGKVNQTILCQILSIYVAVCQEAGAIMGEWRTSDFCSPKSLTCKEGCFCKPGFFRSGGKCVPNAECGCFYNGVYHQIYEKFYPDEHCRVHCTCVGRGQVHCTNYTCPNGTKCTIKDGHQACYPSENAVKCTVMGGRHFRNYDGHNFDFHMGDCHYVLSQVCDTEQSDPIVIIQQGQLHLRVYGVNITLEVGRATVNTQNPNGKQTSDSIFAYSWVTPPSGTNCSEGCGAFCSVCNSTMGAEFASDNFCGVLSAHAGSFSGCHSTVDPQPFFKNCVNDLCASNGGLALYCNSLRGYTFACQEAGAGVQPWRAEKCSLSCPANSHYNVCVSACPESCATLSDTPCPSPCVEGCRCDSGYVQSGEGCVKAEDCGCFYRGHYYELREMFWTEGCAEWCNCSAPDTLFCEPTSCPEGVSCTHNHTWGCAGKAMSCPVNSHYESCGSACPATCQGPSGLAPCTLACVETCQCDPGFVLQGDACVPSSQCGCVHDGYHYHGNQTFWADEGCTERCVCDPRTHRTRCQLASCGPDEYCGLRDGVRVCVPHPWQTCVYSGRHFTTFDQHDYDLQGTCQYQLLGVCGPRRGLAPVEVHVQSDGHLESALHVLVIVNGTLVEMNSKNIERIEVNGVSRSMPYLLNPTAVAFSVGLHTYIYTDFGFVFSLGVRGGVDVRLSGKYANATCGLCGNFNSDPADDLTATGSQERLNPEQFGKAWRSGRNPWCVEGCLGGSCPTCLSEQRARYSDPGACGRILEANGPFRDCHGKVDPSSFYKRCVDDLCLHGGLQHVLCNSLAEYTAACLFHQARVHTWRSSGFCHHSCPSDTSYSMSSAPVHFCLGWLNRTVEMPSNAGENCLCEAGLFHSGTLCVPLENCGCFHHGEYLRAGQEMSTCERSCVCHAGGRVVCRNVPCGQGEECALRRGVPGCRPRPKEARCSADGGSQYTTFDGQTFDLYGSCNYTLAQTCSLKETDAAPFTIAVQGGQKTGMQIYLQANKMHFKISDNYPDQVQVNGVLENLPFSQNNVTVLQENGRLTIQALGSVQLSSDLYNHILVKIPDVYQRTTCGLCGNYNGDRSDDLQLPDGTAVSDPNTFASSWRSSDAGSSCGDATYRPCAPAPAYTSDLRCGLLTHPTGPFSPCHRLVHPQRYHALCMAHLCVTRGQSHALCGSLQAYELACREAGADIGVWRNTTGCAYQCPQFSHYSQCANACSSLCPGVGRAARCPGVCEEGCRCDGGHLYDGHACVPAGRCGCLHNGRRFEASESRLLQNCTVKCACGPPLVCEEHSCPAQHSCVVSDGVMGCSSAVANSPDPCEGRCERSKECLLSNGAPVCKTPQGFCWARGGRHYRTFDGPGYGLEGACTYLLAASRGAALGPTPFSVSVKNDCCGSARASSAHVLTVQAYGFVVQLNREKGAVWIQVADGGGEVRLNTDFGLQVVFDWASTVAVTLDPHYMGEVYGLCGNFNGDSLDEHTAAVPGTPPSKSVYVAQARRLYNGDNDCLTKQSLDNPAPTVAPEIISSYRRLCAVLKDQQGRFAHCHSKVDPGSFYQSCVAELTRNGGSKVSLDQAMNSYSMVCGQVNDGYDSGGMIDASCPPNSHYKTCGSSCPPSCESILAYCNKKCVRGCFCDPGFLKSPEGCVRPEQCGCRDSTGKYHSINTTFWTPENCGQTCVCDPAAGAVDCKPAQCRRGQVCKRLGHKSFCQPKDPVNCTLVAGLYFTTFDGHHFDFRDGCAYSLVQSSSNHTELTPFNITISDASCQNRLFHSLNLKLSVYSVEMVVNKDDPEKFLVDGLHKALPYSHQTGRVQAYRTPSSLVVHVDFGLQLILYKTGAITVILPSAYASSVSGLCGNANGDPRDDGLMPDGERAQNALEFAHSWRSGGTDACRSGCPPPGARRCPAEARRLFEGCDFCGVLLNELGPFEECAATLSPERYFRGCVADACSYGGHASALCNAVASYAAACQAAQLPVRQWRSDTFCGMTCPENSHYELCGPRCPAACAGPSSPTNCSGGCQEGCQCDPGYVLSDGRCALLSDCGCVRDGQYYPAGSFYPGNGCQKCDCRRGEVTCDPAPCGPQESCTLEGGLARCRPLQYGACQVLAGFGYVTFDGLALTHHGACTYIVSELSSKTLHDYTLLLGFKKERNGTVHKISRVVFRWSSLELSIDPETPWKIQLNREELSLPFDMGKIRAYQDGRSLTIATVVGVKIQLSSTQYLRLSVPQGYDTTASGLCGNFNGDQSDDLQLQSNRLTNSTAEFLHSWAVVAPGRRCDGNCGTACDECSVSPEATTACDVLLVRSGAFVHCRNGGADARVYRDACVRAVCAGAGPEEAACLALEAYAAACRAQGRTVGPWREDTSCPLPCPDRSGPDECVDSGSNSCPALLRPGSAAAGCSEGCRCLKGHVFDGDECVPRSRCGCVIHERYVKMDQQLYTKDCTQRCWCHPLGGALCETAACDPGQQCALKNGSWGCHEQPGVCGLWLGLKAITLSGQQLSLEPRVSYSLLSLCDETSDQWFSLVSYNGPCGGDSSRAVTVVQVLLHGLSVAIRDGKVKVNGRAVSLPYMLPSGVSLSSSVTPDKSEVTVVLRKDAGLESELEMEIGVTMVTVKLPLWYTGELCGLCEDRGALRPSESSSGLQLIWDPTLITPVHEPVRSTLEILQ